MSIIDGLNAIANPERALVSARFFKTGPGCYGEGDIFWGIPIPDLRKLIKGYSDLSSSEMAELLHHPVHEVRMAGVLLLVGYSKKNPEEAYRVYMANRGRINNWDLIDASAEYVVGRYLDTLGDLSILHELAGSLGLWDRRISIISTFHFIKQGHSDPTLAIAARLVHDPEDLIQKAVGWMLREVGKRVSVSAECEFLDQWAATMPRMMLRYAIERFPASLRSNYMMRH